MPLSPSQRIDIITEIARRLANEEWPLIDLTLQQFDLPSTDIWSGYKDEYVIRMISEADDDSLLAVGHHVGYEVEGAERGVVPPFWTDGSLRLFLSHLSTHRQLAGELKEALAKYGISAFVAHTDIHPATEWQDELESGLRTAEVLVALMHDGFSDSQWTDQEVGFAMGRGLPTYSVRYDQTPYGFIGRFQAFNGNNKSPDDLAREIFDTLRTHKQTQRRMSEILVNRFENSGSFNVAKQNIKLLEEMEHWTKQYSERISKACEHNTQISSAWGVPERVEALIARWRERGV